MYTVLLAAMLFISATLAGIIFTPAFEQKSPDEVEIPQWYHCCDSGDGKDCKPSNTETFKFAGSTYALLKSNSYPIPENPTGDQDDHFENTNHKVEPNVGKVFLNVANRNDNHSPSGKCDIDKISDTDWIRFGDNDGDDHACSAIAKGTLIYLCRYDKNPSQLCDKRDVKDPIANLDVYIRLENDGSAKIPNEIKNCNKPKMPKANDPKIVFRPSPEGQPNLQLRTFKFVEEVPRIRWLAPFCKPAVYLYPERKSEINVSVFPQGKMLLTIPPYPKNGWDVVAEPDGTIHYGTENFDYLYYEASLPDQIITQPTEGYVIDYEKRGVFLADLVSRLGLNEKESAQFLEYWIPILPKSPYYFIGIIPDHVLREISPLFITPQPRNVIRVSLYFKPLEHKMTVKPPIILPVSREGFTAVEWGGIFKQDKAHPFSCFM
jgi:hypothetical protein